MVNTEQMLPLGELLLRRGRLTASQLEDALRVQRRLVDQGLEKLLGDILVAKGFASADEIKNVLQQQQKRVVVCGACRSEFSILENENPGSTVVCPHCSRKVKVPADLKRTTVAVPADAPGEEQSTVPVAYLIVKRFREDDRVIPVFRGASLVLGTSPECQVAVEGDGIAERHCELIERTGELHLSSFPGSETWVNGSKVERCNLHFGDMIVVGHVPCMLSQGMPRKSGVDEFMGRHRTSFVGWEPAELVGETLNGYRILGQLGSGGMSIVYLAEQLALGRLVALKILKKDFGGNRKTIERFMREARAGAKLNHRNIVMVYDAGFYAGLGYIVMEYVDGEDVGKWIKRLGRLPLDLTISIGVQVATALEIAHAAGVVHRDVKPSNILFSKDGTAKLLDLGIAKIVEEAGFEDGKAGVGTLSYMPPEQTSNASRADHRADIYSLGATLYKMLVGQPPFRASTVEELIKSIRSEPLPDPRLAVPGLPLSMVKVLQRAMEKSPDDRYPELRSMKDDLLAVL